MLPFYPQTLPSWVGQRVVIFTLQMKNLSRYMIYLSQFWEVEEPLQYKLLKGKNVLFVFILCLTTPSSVPNTIVGWIKEWSIVTWCLPKLLILKLYSVFCAYILKRSTFHQQSKTGRSLRVGHIEHGPILQVHFHKAYFSKICYL